MLRIVSGALASCFITLLIWPVASGAAVISASQVKHAQMRLAHLGFEVGAADGVAGPLTARAMCAYELVGSGRASLGTMNVVQYRELMRTKHLPRAVHPESSYLSVSTRCQVLYEVLHHRYVRIIPVSTGRVGVDSLGRPSFATRTGRWKIYNKIDRWQESNQYSGGMMYRPMYFSGGEAVHGEASSSSVLPYFASHGCVRVLRSDQDSLWPQSPIGTVVYVS
jgi:lipoprotein-anchoring transpeptidase ErfK/SrfK